MVGDKATRFAVEEQHKFLISCIRHSNNGKINFAEVQKECDAVSKGAAAKRYERLLKAHGIHPSSAPTNPRDSSLKSAPRAKPKARKSNDATPKKRKVDDADSPDDGEETDEDSTPLKKKKKDEDDDASYPHPLSVKKEEEEGESDEKEEPDNDGEESEEATNHNDFTPINGSSKE